MKNKNKKEKAYLVSLLEQIDRPEEYDKKTSKIARDLKIGAFLAVIAIILFISIYGMTKATLIGAFIVAYLLSFSTHVQNTLHNSRNTRKYLNRSLIEKRLAEIST